MHLYIHIYIYITNVYCGGGGWWVHRILGSHEYRAILDIFSVKTYQKFWKLKKTYKKY